MLSCSRTLYFHGKSPQHVCQSRPQALEWAACVAHASSWACPAQVGIPVRVLERESGPRREGSAIGLWPNAFRALDALGLAQPLREAHPLFDRYAACHQAAAVQSWGLSAVLDTAEIIHASTCCRNCLFPTTPEACTELNECFLMVCAA